LVVLRAALGVDSAVADGARVDALTLVAGLVAVAVNVRAASLDASDALTHFSGDAVAVGDAYFAAESS